jgi:exopolysaccharide biosynthesis polyprenyl glycosylphosphotransferase
MIIITPTFFLARYYFYLLLEPDRLKIRLLIITNLEYALEFQKEIDRRGGKWEIFYLLDKDSIKKAKNINYLNILGEIDTELDKVVKENWTGIVLAVKSIKKEHINTLIEIKRNGIPVYDLVYFYEYYFFKIPLYFIDDSWFLLSKGFMLIESTLIIRIKYLMDKILALLLLIIFSPIMVLIAIAIYIDDGFPILFRQERLGKDKKPFIAYKFRTMIKDADKYNPLTKEKDPRIIRIGHFLRKSRLDELPQLFNVLKGEMSLIGPRAESTKVTKIYENEIKYYHIRHLVKTGLTGWAQIMYPYGESIEDEIQKLEYDLYYIKNYSFLLDFSIIIKTFRIMFFGRGR